MPAQAPGAGGDDQVGAAVRADRDKASSHSFRGAVGSTATLGVKSFLR